MNHHLIWPKQRDFKKDLQDVLDFCKEQGFYFRHFGKTLLNDPVNESNINAKYRIIRSCTDGDQHTYSMMEAFVDEDDCDCYKVVFDIPVDYYNTDANLIEEFRKLCKEYILERG